LFHGYYFLSIEIPNLSTASIFANFDMTAVFSTSKVYPHMLELNI